MTDKNQSDAFSLYAEHTQNWVERVIMKYNICPFARREVERRSIRYIATDAKKMKLVLEALIKECQLLDADPEIEMTLFIIPKGFEGFYAYLDLVDLAERLLISEGYEGVYQLATFHPDYCFEGEPMEDPSNYTNRSPYPTLHIIREASMAHVLATYKNPEAIPERNIQFAQRRGSDFFEKILAGCIKE